MNPNNNSFNILPEMYYMPDSIARVNARVENKTRQDLCLHEVYIISVRYHQQINESG